MLCLSKKQLASMIYHASSLKLHGCCLHQTWKYGLQSCCNSDVHQPAILGGDDFYPQCLLALPVVRPWRHISCPSWAMQTQRSCTFARY